VCDADGRAAVDRRDHVTDAERDEFAAARQQIPGDEQ
jgi:hypothetical protein